MRWKGSFGPYLGGNVERQFVLAVVLAAAALPQLAGGCEPCCCFFWQCMKYRYCF
jgi:hypothetical protein